MPKIFCEHCGKGLRPGARFCHTCGAVPSIVPQRAPGQLRNEIDVMDAVMNSNAAALEARTAAVRNKKFAAKSLELRTTIKHCKTATVLLAKPMIAGILLLIVGGIVAITVRESMDVPEVAGLITKILFAIVAVITLLSFIGYAACAGAAKEAQAKYEKLIRGD